MAKKGSYTLKGKKAFDVDGPTDEAAARDFAKVTLDPRTAGLRVIDAAERGTTFGEGLDLRYGLLELRELEEALHRDDMQPVENALLNQAVALQTLFVRLTERAMASQYRDGLEAFLKLALRAQNQSRMTFETLATVKNPPVVYARQANVTTGPQQINNGLPAGGRDSHNPQNKLLEQTHGERLDPGATGETIGSNPSMEAVGAVHRAED
ncbi:MAG: hypothetical protein FJ189_00885 [Gammaproteobacteria bacterium]|nr:hypothetical protein [Gammaproteobacteria bacterium]